MFVMLKRMRIFTVNETNKITAGILRGHKVHKDAGDLTMDALNAVAIHMERKRELAGSESEVIPFPESNARLIWERKIPSIPVRESDMDVVVRKLALKLEEMLTPLMPPIPMPPTATFPSQPEQILEESTPENAAVITLSDEQASRLNEKVADTINRFLSEEFPGDHSGRTGK